MEESNVIARELTSLPLVGTQRLLQDKAKLWWSSSAVQCIHAVFEQQVESTPDATALVCASQQLTYSELNRRANQLAHYLRGRGVSADQPVGICVDRSIEMAIGLLGVLKAGGGYVPLDPEYPRERLSLMLADSGLRLLLTQRHLTDKLPQHRAGVVRLDADWDEIAQSADTNLAETATPENLVYMIYTSGSTGRPKGVMVPHRALYNHMAWMQQRFPLTPEDRIIQKTPFSFDASVWEIFAPLLAGARLSMAAPGGHQDPDYLVRFMAEQQITALKIVPSLLEQLLEEEGFAQLSSLRYVFCGAEAMSVKLAEKFFDRTEAELFNLYGPTEAAIDVTYWQCERGHGLRSIPIGKPITNTEVYVLDGRMRAAPIGVGGELYIGGQSLARAYWNRAELTAEGFVPNPFSSTPGARLYRTGDVVRWSDEEELEYLGRNDQQVKIRGYRIETGEIEAALLERAEVGRAVVLVREEEDRGKQLAAFVVSSNGIEPSARELRGYLEARLPEYMVPASFAVIAALPLMPNGKIDRQALLSLNESGPERESEYEGARNDVEALLVKVWQDVLGLEQVGIHDNFFELGGDSILSIQIAGKAHQLGLPVRVRQIFQHRTIAELAIVVTLTSAADPTAEIEPDVTEGEVLLTPIQHRFFEMGQPHPEHVNQSVMLEIDTRPEMSMLKTVIEKLVDHHAALRLRFLETENGWQQSYAKAEQHQIVSYVDLSKLAESAQRPQLEKHAAATQASLNITTGPLLRVVIFDLGADKPARLLIAIHHLVMDGVSWRILLEDLQTAYQQTRSGQSIELPAQTSSFKRWAENLRAYAASEELQAQSGYWLKDRQVESLPVDYADGLNTIAAVRSIEVELSRAETQALLRKVPKTYQTQIQEVLATALALAFQSWTGKQTLLLDMEGHGREEVVEGVNLSRTVGWFTSVYPVLLELTGSDISTALKEVKEQLREVPEKGIGYGVCRYLSADEETCGDLRKTVAAEVSFNYLGQFDQLLSRGEFRAAAESTGSVQNPENKRPYLLTVDGMVADGQLRMSWVYNEQIHRRETIECVAEEFVERLRELIAHGRVTGPLSERQSILFDQPGTPAANPGDSLLVTIRSEGRNPPLFCVGSWADDPAFVFADLAENLGAEQPFYGLWFPDDEQFTYQSLAARLVQEIQKVQPAGPYMIGGYSLGGVLAFEVARQLLAGKEEVALLVLLETVCPNVYRDLKLFDDAELAERIVKGSVSDFQVPEAKRSLDVDKRLDYILHRLKSADIVGGEKDLPELKSFLALWRLRGGYTPEPYPGEILVFRTQDKSLRNEQLMDMAAYDNDPKDALGWSMVATRPVKVIQAPGEHSNFILAPHATIVAEQLREYTQALFQRSKESKAADL